MAAVQSAPQVNGHGTYGKNVTEALLKEEDKERSSVEKLSKEHDITLKTIRLLIADLCSQYKAGHPGGAMGMAAIGVALWKYAMRYSPTQADWFNRDRFVLSNGHACLFQYCFLHFAGYPAFDFDMLKTYHSEKPESLCPGHPEIEAEGIEVTTGPLGQGITNAVGLAMATKHLAAQYNRDGFEVVNNHTWCMIGDACPQEGIGQEAISLAGHWKLNNLTVIYDNNQITCDGSVDMTNSEDINARFRAAKWDVIDVYDGCFNVDGIVEALKKAKQSRDKPTLVNVRTIIGVGSAVAGQAVAHGVPFKADDVEQMKKAYGFDPSQTFIIPEIVRNFFSDLPSKGRQHVKEWDELVASYSRAHPKIAAEFQSRREGNLPSDWESLIPSSFPNEATASRKSSGLTFQPIADKHNQFMIGTADLSPSVNLLYPSKVAFQNPHLETTCGINGTYAGRYIHYGVREHAMAAISNGLAAYNPGTIIPITSSFFMFYLYAAPAVRMGALQKLQVIHVATHDSIGMGEDGPTHQPIELAALFRAMPELLYIRPGDSEEVAGAWSVAIKHRHGPTIISCSRHALKQYPGKTDRSSVAKGAYVLEESDGKPDVTMIGVGAELSFAVDVAEELETKGFKTRVVSFPCMRLFEQQSVEYKRGVLKRNEAPAVVIEPYAALGWERYADAGVNMKTFGHSLTNEYVYKHFGYEVGSMAERVEGFLQARKRGEILQGEYADL
ncbi:Transketolase, thiamine diphosphate binding domain-containing protein [Elsinoe ampelina]|uniref:transketolase n=1 Tax=Elsinoe ampelina TaxID=302913 RepID=A0A6A6GLJ0_9PEZI|nr:Transketolase, thiamine diphosphate binding domain-containing protein [Elsinoe ampelina]